MPLLFNRLILLKMRRLLEFSVLLCFFIIVLTIRSSWISTTPADKQTYTDTRIKHIPYALNLENVRPLNADNDEKLKNSFFNGRPNLPKYVHLDLKGAPPQANRFYEGFFNFLDKLQMGIKGVLIEYEDTLPLDGKLRNATHRFPYTKSDIELIQTAAKSHELDVIPLIQTFGHMEWLLKLREYEFYRDDLGLATVITPCLDETYILLEDLLQQTLDMHPNSNIIHIGCDEVQLTSSHPKCQDIWMDPSERYVEHVKRVVKIVQKIRPGIRILIWDDVIRSDAFIINQKLLTELKDLVEPVAWNYRPTFDESYILSPIWSIYSNLFPNTWAASAFKGGLNRFSLRTNTTHHVLNNYAWLQFIESFKNEKNNSFTAIILTGWSRFDHFMPLCDLLPTAYQSLLSSLYAINTGKILPEEYIHDCDELMHNVERDPQLCQLLPGLSIWSGISSLSNSISQIEIRLQFLNTVAPPYNRKHLFVRRSELNSRLDELEALRNDFSAMVQFINRNLNELYTFDIIDEWSSLYLMPILDQINTTLIEFLPVRNQTSWSRRPLV